MTPWTQDTAGVPGGGRAGRWQGRASRPELIPPPQPGSMGLRGAAGAHPNPNISLNGDEDGPGHQSTCGHLDQDS